ncbi:MAG: DNRLRE domain-containing protein [Ruminiclostridium sp.]|nr:DNRLRE domain-containing protein [Ruminiclostridium sp.]
MFFSKAAKKLLLLVCVLLLITVFSGLKIFPGQVVFAADDAYDTLRIKYRNMVTGGTTFDMNDANVAAKVHKIEADTQKYLSTINSTTHVWDDLESQSQYVEGQYNSRYTRDMYDRFLTMSLAWYIPSSSYYHDTTLYSGYTLLDHIKGGLDWLYTNRYNSSGIKDSWWYWQIGIPFKLLDVTVVLYDQLSSQQISNYMGAVDFWVPTPSNTGANRADLSKVVALKGIIAKNFNDPLRDEIQEASDGLSILFPYVTKKIDGFYTDGSFIQHWNLPYISSYGADLIKSLSDVLWLLSGSQWDNTDANKGNIYEWVFDTYEPNLFKGQNLHATRARDVARYLHDGPGNGADVLRGIYVLSELTGNPYASEMKSIIKYHTQGLEQNFYDQANIWLYNKVHSVITDTNVTPRPELTGNYQYYNQDTAVHRRPGWTFSLRMQSDRIAPTEILNTENLHGWYQGDGVGFLYENAADYLNNYMVTVDPHRMPGITVDRDPNRPDDFSNTYWGAPQGLKSFAGGVSIDGIYGLSGMDFKQHDYSNMDVSAKKSWFMFDDEVVCLGSDIDSTSGRTIETIVENRALNSTGDNAFKVNGTAKSTTLGWSETMTGVSYAHLDGTGGYYFPGGATIKGLREKRTGETSDINKNTYYGSDAFNLTSLDNSWSFIREDKNYWSLTGTEFQNAAQQGTISGATNTTKNILLKEAPRGDYFATVKLTFSPTSTGQEAGLIVYLDDDNYLYVSRAKTASGNKFSAVNEVSASTTTNSVNDTLGSTVYVKIDKKGNDYSLYKSSDGTNWGTAIYTYTRSFSIPAGQILKIGLFAQRGSSGSAINANFDDFTIKHVNNFLTLWYDHGTDPNNGTYSYVLLPTMTSTQVSTYAGSPEISIVKQTTGVHAIKETTLNIMGASFFEDTGDTADYISSRNASSMMVKSTTNELTFAVSDPTHKQSKLTFELNKKGLTTVSKDSEVTVIQLTPNIIFEVNTSVTPGKTYNVKFTYDGSVVNLPPNAPTGVNGMYDTSSWQTNLNWDAAIGASTYSVYRSETSGSGYTLLDSGLTSTSYSDITAQPLKTYYYVVKAVNTYGSSVYSNEIAVATVLKTVVNLEAVADAYVYGGSYENNNYGSSPDIELKNVSNPSYAREIYLKFDLSGLSGISNEKFISSAKLYLFGKPSPGYDQNVEVHKVDTDTWIETGTGSITWSNKPASTGLLSSATVYERLDWTAWDVTSYVKTEFTGDKTVSLVMKGGDALWSNYQSREAFKKPYIEIEYTNAVSVNPTADAYVKGGSTAGQNYGSSNLLEVRQMTSDEYTRYLYSKFDLTGIGNGKTVMSAKLHFYGSASYQTNSDVEVYGVDDDSWTETGLLWTNKPALSSLLTTVNVTDTRTWRVFDVTSYVRQQNAGDQIISLAMKGFDTAYTSWDSKETANKPYLEVEFSDTANINPAADTYVKGGSTAGQNFGSNTVLEVRKGTSDEYTRYLYSKFDLTGWGAGSIASAKLYIYGSAASGTNSNVEAHGVNDDSWIETGMTWNDRPAFSSLQTTVNVNDTLGWKVFDVTSYVASQYSSGDKIVSLGLRGYADTAYSSYQSKEASNKPYLKVTFAP